jgi:putative membrane protein
MMYYNNGFGFPWFIFGLFWIVIFVAIFGLLAGGGRRHHMHGDYRHWHEHQAPSDPLDIVKERYAKGEINKEEFECIKKDLQDHS